MDRRRLLTTDPVDVLGAPDPVAAVLLAHVEGRRISLTTSGTTAQPRSVVRTAASWVDSFPVVSQLTGIGPGSRVWVPGPLTASMNLFAAAHARWLGADVATMPAGATHACLTPAALVRALDDRVDVTGMHLVVAGDRLRRALAQRASDAGARVSHYYGAAELSFVAWGSDEEDLSAFSGVELEIRDGVIWVCSPYLSEGYLVGGGPFTVDADGFATVGDRGRLTGDVLTVAGRGAEVVVTGGATVLVDDVEQALSCSCDAEVVVVGVPHARLGQLVAAVSTDEAALAAARAAASAQLTPAQRPRLWLHLDRWPLTAAGKLDRAAVAELARSRPADVTGAAPVIVAALRSPIGTAGRSLAAVPAAELAAPVLAAVAEQVPDAAQLRDVLLGNCTGPGGDLARVAALHAGLPHDLPALTVDRQCASGLAAIALGASVVSAEPGIVLAGGVESASTAPWRFWPPVGDAAPVRYERAPFAPAAVGDPDMGPAADALALEYGISRAAQDEYAARSHARAIATVQEGGFAAEIVPVAGVTGDDRPRSGLTVERLARLRPAFGPGGTHTAGNSCGINDGAAVVALTDAATHRRLGVPGLRVLATATAGLDPNRLGLSLVPAVRAALDRAGLTLDDIDVVEFNEAFAGQILACCQALGLDPVRICPQGGALALGHPWGASGAVLAVRLFSQLVRQRAGRYGLAAIAAGGGQGVAMVVEAVS